MNRRDFLQYAALATSGSLMLPFANATDLSKTGRIVVLVHLKGGNDGFNTLVPYADDEYYTLRPQLGLKERTLITLKDGFGMHPRLRQLVPLWKRGQMAFVQGLGYPNSVLSHFQSQDIWESASIRDYSSGWLSHVVPRMKKGLHGIVIDDGVEGGGVMLGSNLNAVTMKNPKTFIKAARRIDDIKISHRNHAIAHVTTIQHQLHAVGVQIEKKVGSNPPAVPGRYTGKLGHGLEAVAQMILSGVDAPVYKVTQEGFDTHSGQITGQSNALFQLANGISSFANAMNQRGMWKKILIVTYSEFGRRARENKNIGTDHGTASAHMIFGGNIRAGIWGKHPDLKRLDANGNVHHTADFRALYGTIAQNWWHQSHPWRGYGTLPFLG